MTETLVPMRLPEPPPAVTVPDFQLDLVDGERVVGWITRDRIAFHGFGDRVEAAHAAWAAHRTLSWRLASRFGSRPLPVATEPLTIVPEADELHVHASGRRFATLRAPAARQEGWAFVLTLPAPMADIFVTAKAYAIYRMLRRSGIRWTMWMPKRAPDPSGPESEAVPAESPERPSWYRATAVFASFLLIVVALLASERMAALLAFLGLGGLFAARLAAMGQEWPHPLGRTSRPPRLDDRPSSR